MEFEIKLFEYIFFEKFKKCGSAQNYFKKTAGNAIKLIFAYFLKNLPENVLERPKEDANFEDQTRFALRSIDSYFGSGLFSKIEPFTDDNKIPEMASSPLPSVQFSGKFFLIMIHCLVYVRVTSLKQMSVVSKQGQRSLKTAVKRF